MFHCTIVTSWKCRWLSLVLRNTVSVYGCPGLIALTRSLQTTPPFEGARATRERRGEWEWREKKGSRNFMNDVSQLASFFFFTSSRLFLTYFPYDEEAKKIARMIIFLRPLVLRAFSRGSLRLSSLENSLTGYSVAVTTSRRLLMFP